jgi:hypothetical protein
MWNVVMCFMPHMCGHIASGDAHLTFLIPRLQTTLYSFKLKELEDRKAKEEANRN